jgi:diaminopimelate epimerase
MNLKFTKMVAAGNDFVVLDARDNPRFIQCGGELARQLCPRRFSIGADGLLLLANPPEDAPELDFAMIYFNADGSRGEMCGNGARSLALFAKEAGVFEKQARFVTDAGKCRVEIQDGGRIRLSMPPGQILAANVDASTSFARRAGAWIDSGVPHFVTWVESAEALAEVDLAAEGRALRFHPAFEPKGANVNFAFAEPPELHEPGAPWRCAFRTYERGVEAETLGCGSGAIAVAAARLLTLGQPSGKVAARTTSGEVLEVGLALRERALADVFLAGGAKIVLHGEIKAGFLNLE